MTKIIFRFILVTCLFINMEIVTAQTIAGAKKPPVIVMKPMRIDPHEYLKHVKLPPGFNISIYAANVIGARSLSLSPNGTLFVGTFEEFGKGAYGKVYAIQDNNNDNKGDEVIVIAEKLNFPNGVAFHDGNLYVAEISQITRYDNIEETLRQRKREAVVINATYPTDKHHGWKFIRFGPDGKLYVPVGAPCNTCEPDDTHSVITRIDPDGSNMEVYARGIRNTVGFDWHPETGELWFTDNGRDLMGNDIPPEELNHAPKPGLHFGFPYRYGKDLLDPGYQTTMKPSDFQAAALELPAHSAPLGIRFYTGNSFPKQYKNQIFIAHHGSWNRSPPQGYKIAVVKLKDNKPVSYEDFATGWLIGDRHWGRLTDIEIMPDGSLLVSDELSHCIYRISYEG